LSGDQVPKNGEAGQDDEQKKQGQAGQGSVTIINENATFQSVREGKVGDFAGASLENATIDMSGKQQQQQLQQQQMPPLPASAHQHHQGLTSHVTINNSGANFRNETKGKDSKTSDFSGASLKNTNLIM
jgi:hypothetical protein